MPRFLRIAEKKKGTRFTGARWARGVGEVILMSVLMLIGLVISILVAASQWQTVASGQPGRWPFFALQFAAAIAIYLTGLIGILRILWSEGTSAERREAIVNRAREINLLNEVKPVADDWPHVPVEVAWTLTPGEKLRFQLKQRQKPRWNLVVSGILVFVFVGVTSIVTFMTWNSFLQGKIDLFGAGLNVALILASVFSFQLFLQQLLSLTGIGATQIEIDEFPLYQGASYQLRLVQFGRVRLKLIDLELKCIEEATYRDGTDLRNESRIVFSNRILRKRGVDVAQGQPFEAEVDLHIPHHAMHSFSSTNNKVNWILSVEVTARGWPDQSRTFPILLAPQAGTEG